MSTVRACLFRLLVIGASVDTLRLWEVSLPKRDVKP
jgi:hypothetical protein